MRRGGGRVPRPSGAGGSRAKAFLIIRGSRGRLILLVSESILTEVEDVLARPEVLRKLRVTAREARAVLNRLRRRATLVNPDITIRASRDPSDDKFLECAVVGNADYVVSEDADLL